MVRTCRREFFVELPFFVSIQTLTPRNRVEIFCNRCFPLELTAVLKIYREENLPKLFKIVKNGILKNRIGDNTVFSRFDGVFQKYEFQHRPVERNAVSGLLVKPFFEWFFRRFLAVQVPRKNV